MQSKRGETQRKLNGIPHCSGRSQNYHGRNDGRNCEIHLTFSGSPIAKVIVFLIHLAFPEYITWNFAHMYPLMLPENRLIEKNRNERHDIANKATSSKCYVSFSVVFDELHLDELFILHENIRWRFMLRCVLPAAILKIYGLHFSLKMSVLALAGRDLQKTYVESFNGP